MLTRTASVNLYLQGFEIIFIIFIIIDYMLLMNKYISDISHRRLRCNNNGASFSIIVYRMIICDFSILASVKK